MSAVRATFSKARSVFSVAVVIALVGTLAYLVYRQSIVPRTHVLIDGRIRVEVEVMLTPAAQEKGLSGHAPLAADQGMLFLFDSPQRYGFWMKDMTFPIDIIWIAGEKVADITVNAAIPVQGQDLPIYSPRVPVDKVLEVPAGFAALHGLRIGSTVEIQQKELP
jgi:uncharacterized protein